MKKQQETRPSKYKNPKHIRDRVARYARNYRAKHPEKTKEARRTQYVRRKLRAIKMVGNPLCVRCGCDEVDFLEFNHVGGGGCIDWRANGGQSPMERLLSGKMSSVGLEILCRVCNAVEFLERKNKKSAKQFGVFWKKVIGQKSKK